jgi:hypothetical protein
MADSTRSSFPLCYGCGQENPIGFKLVVRQENGETLASFTPGPYHSGFTEKVHGGVLCALLDEVMVYLPFLQGLKSVTGKMEVHFRRPARPGEAPPDKRPSAETAPQGHPGPGYNHQWGGGGSGRGPGPALYSGQV